MFVTRSKSCARLSPIHGERATQNIAVESRKR